MDDNRTCRTRHSFASARQLIQRLAAHLYRRIHGRRLHAAAQKAPQHGAKRRFVQPGRYGRRLQHLPGDIASVGAQPQAQRGLVGFIRVGQHVHRLGSAPHKYRQHACCHGVQRTGVAYFARAQNTPQLRIHIERGEACGLIHY